MYFPKTRAKVMKLVLQETGTYNPMFERPMVMNVTGENLDSLITAIDQSQIKRVQANNIAGMAYGMVAPSSTPGSQIIIPNGWDSRRVRFILHVIVDNQTLGLTNEEYFFQGFTDYAGVTSSGVVDPNMVLVINNFVKLADVINHTPQGIVYDKRVAESGQIINGDVIYNNTGVNNYGLRPGDMFLGIQSQNIYHSQNDRAPMYDSRFQLNQKAVKANKYNVTPANYLASLTDTYCMAALSNNIQQNGQDIYETSKANVAPDNIHLNSFLKLMKSVKGIGNGTTFTMADLERIDPELRHKTQCFTIGPTNRHQVHSVGQTEYWDGANLETQYATILGNAVPALLMELMLSSVTFMASNYSTGGEGVITLIDGISITGAPMMPFFEVFKVKMLTEVLRDISFNNQMRYNLTMKVDIFGETIIDLALNGGPETRYTVPTFFDSISTPMMTHSRDHFFNTVNVIDELLTNVHGAIGSEYAMMGQQRYSF